MISITDSFMIVTLGKLKRSNRGHVDLNLGHVLTEPEDVDGFSAGRLNTAILSHVIKVLFVNIYSVVLFYRVFHHLQC